MPEYIKRMSAMTICERYSQHCFETNDNRGQDIADRIFDEITENPTADVFKVVRCKECKDYSPVIFNGEPMHYGYCCNTHDSVLGNRHRYEGDFCSYGQLKELQNAETKKP